MRGHFNNQKGGGRQGRTQCLLDPTENAVLSNREYLIASEDRCCILWGSVLATRRSTPISSIVSLIAERQRNSDRACSRDRNYPACRSPKGLITVRFWSLTRMRSLFSEQLKTLAQVGLSREYDLTIRQYVVALVHVSTRTLDIRIYLKPQQSLQIESLRKHTDPIPRSEPVS